MFACILEKILPYQSSSRINRRMIHKRRIEIHPVQIDPSGVRPIVPLNHPVGIQERQQLEHIQLPQRHCHRVLPVQQQRQQPVENKARRSLARMHPGRHKHYLLSDEPEGPGIRGFGENVFELQLAFGADVVVGGDGDEVDASAFQGVAEAFAVVVYVVFAGDRGDEIVLVDVDEVVLEFGVGVGIGEGEVGDALDVFRSAVFEAESENGLVHLKKTYKPTM